jgi:hypothetical protein
MRGENMAEYQIIPKATLDPIEESIQRKRGSQAPIEPSEMPLAIDTIPSSVDGTDVPVGGIYFTKPDENGNPTECYIIGYAPINNYSWSNQLSVSYFPHLSKVSFVNCKKITSIGNAAFQNCSSLATINLPYGITSIGTYAFQNCSSLATINLPDGITSIGLYAFFDCSSLTTINLPDSIVSIGNAAFYGCSSLTTINLPNSITSIAADAFFGCLSLTDVTIESGFNCNGLTLSSSTRYTAETIVSWLEALADRTGQATFKLTIGATNLNKLTAEQKAIATNKNWTLA